jgi:hypothetical protein
MIHSHDEVVWLALSRCTRVVSLAFAGTVVICAHRVVVVAPREPFTHFLLLLGPIVHHVTKSCNSFWSVPPKVTIDAWVGEATIEAVDDVLFQNVRNGGSYIK